mmetsp:Transcript_30339/g.50103  ORF Transcript_30339/g.50103 Transcript_30339/m.50103 type:complete len:192 (+) Transcript_30339:95-670(+)
MIDPVFRDASLPWAIDMDGTLIREDVTDLAMIKSLQNPLFWFSFLYACLLVLFRGSAYGARYLETRFIVNPKTLTYNQKVIEIIEGHRKLGGHVILATASHHLVAKPVAKYVGIFDGFIGSDPPSVMDAKAEAKARLLNQRFPKGFIYAGNSEDDMKVWNHEGCLAMFLVNCKPDLLQRAQQIRKPYIVIA